MLSESIGEGFDDGIATSGRERGHVEDAADGFSSAADDAFALVLAAVVVEGSDADEGRDLLSVEGSGRGAVDLLSRVLADGLAIDGISIQPPSHNTLFLNLTGRELRD